MRATRFVLQATLLSAIANYLFAQQTAQITGIVTDPSGAAIASAHITMTNVDTQAKRDANSDGSGSYTIPLLDPGNYQLTVEKQGFRSVSQSGISLHVAQVARIDLVLQLGSVTESVQITAEAPMLNSESSSLGSEMTNRPLINLPQNGLNPVDLALLIPGVMPSRTMSDSFYINPNDYIVDGGRAGNNALLTDGVVATTPEANNDQAVPVLPQIDAVQEFKVMTNALPAEFGHTAGGVLNFVYKSGTNEVHGDVFEFLRNSDLDSNNFFNNRQGLPLATFQRNQFGGAVGGPVFIPRLLDGRNKLFFFAAYEGLRSKTGVTTVDTVPTSAERSGNFSNTFATSGGTCQEIAIYDPKSLQTTSSGAFIRSPFPNNIIPPSEQDPVGVRMASFYPLPNNAGTGCGDANNFVASDASSDFINKPTGRLDYIPNDKDRLFARLSIQRERRGPADPFENVANPNSATYTHGVNSVFSYIRVINPSLLFEFHSGVSRFGNIMFPEAGANFDMADTLGWTGSTGNFIKQMTGPLGFPAVAPSGYSAMGTGTQPWSNEAGNAYQWAASITKVRGAHTLKAGFDYRIFEYAGPNGFIASGSYAFTQSFTQGPNPTAAGPLIGNGVASMLTGLGTGSAQIIPRVYTSSHYYATYLQDDYRVSKKLTFNLGLRYDVETGRTDRYNHLSWFNFTTPSPLAAEVPSLPNLHGGLEFADLDGNPKNQYNLHPHNFSPRAGLAYMLNSSTVLRMGYGILFAPFIGTAVGSSAGYTGFSATTTWVSSLDGITPLNYISNPFPNGLTPPSNGSLGLLTALGTSLGATGRDGAFDRTDDPTYIQQWNVTLERTLLRTLVLDVSYAGNKGTHLVDGGGYDLDQLPPSALALGNQLLQSVPNPFYSLGVIQAGTTLASATTTVGQLLRPYPQFEEVLDFRPTGASSIYHALQGSLEKRLSHGIQVLVSYTFSKLIDDSSADNSNGGAIGLHQDVYDRAADRAVSEQNIPQRFVTSFVADLPFGRGRAIGANWNTVVDDILGGWQVNGILTISSGLAVALTDSSDNSQSDFGGVGASQRPNVNGTSPNLSGGRSTQAQLAEWFNTAVFSQPAAFTWGNVGRVLPTVRGDALRNIDFSLFKNLPLWKEKKITAQIRAEFYNLFNTPNFSPPGGVFGTSTFGVVSAQQNTPRQIQFGLRILF